MQVTRTLYKEPPVSATQLHLVLLRCNDVNSSLENMLILKKCPYKGQWSKEGVQKNLTPYPKHTIGGGHVDHMDFFSFLPIAHRTNTKSQKAWDKSFTYLFTPQSPKILPQTHLRC